MFLPVAGLVVMGFIPRTEEQLLKVVALLTALATAAIGVVTLATFDYDKAGTLQFYVNEPWIDAIQSRFIMGCDGEPAALHPDDGHHAPVHHLQLEPHPRAGQHEGIPHADPAPAGRHGGAFVAQDLILFFVFFEIVLLPMYFMIGVWGGEQRRCASLKFFLFTLFGSAFMLLSFIALFFKSGRRRRPTRTSPSST